MQTLNNLRQPLTHISPLIGPHFDSNDKIAAKILKINMSQFFVQFLVFAHLG